MQGKLIANSAFAGRASIERSNSRDRLTHDQQVHIFSSFVRFDAFEIAHVTEALMAI